jgi:hypothetical protein
MNKAYSYDYFIYTSAFLRVLCGELELHQE